MAATVASLAIRPTGLLSAQRNGTRVAKPLAVTVRAAAQKNDVQEVIVKSTALATLAGSLLYSGNAQAAMEVANIADGDGRGLLLGFPLAAAVGWVVLQIAGPAKNQIDNMSKGAVAGLGLGAASLLAAQSADAAEIMQLADGDSRGAILLFPLAAAIGWVVLQIAGPAKNQIDNMNKGLVAGLGLTAASLIAASGADAAEIMQLADGDSRGGLLLFPLAAAIGWVVLQIAGPAKNQIDSMSKGLVGGLGLGAASLLATQSADAAEIMQLADGDGRGLLLGFPLAAAVGWVVLQIAGPAKNQIDNMSKGLVAGLGLGAASLLAAQSADAAEIMQLADADSRGAILLFPLAAAVGWVVVQIAGPAKNQIDSMSK